MMQRDDSRLIRVRMTAVALLAIILLALLVVGWISPGERTRGEPPADPQVLASIGRAVDSLLTSYGIPPARVTTWRAGVTGRTFTRVVQRVYVSRDFVGFSFNHDLASAIAGFDANVVGTERTRENILTLHVVRRGVTIRSISFEPKPPDR